MTPGRGARPGGALYPVLIIMGLLFMMSTLLPQVLVDASSSIRIDRSRDALMDAVDSGIAFAEARLRKQLAALVTAGDAAIVEKKIGPGSDSLIWYQEGAAPSFPKTAGWLSKPTYDNPDFGHDHPYDFEARCVRVHLFHVNHGLASETYQFSYTIDAGAWNKHGASKHVLVNGVMEVPATVDTHGIRTVDEAAIRVQGINREIPGSYVKYAARS